MYVHVAVACWHGKIVSLIARREIFLTVPELMVLRDVFIFMKFIARRTLNPPFQSTFMWWKIQREIATVFLTIGIGIGSRNSGQIWCCAHHYLYSYLEIQSVVMGLLIWSLFMILALKSTLQKILDLSVERLHYASGTMVLSTMAIKCRKVIHWHVIHISWGQLHNKCWCLFMGCLCRPHLKVFLMFALSRVM